MITITKQDNGVLFEFEDSKKYLYGNGSILVPFNTLSIIADESNMITIRKAASNDIFLSARYDTDLGYRSKDDAIDELKDLLFAETGGGSGSGITSGDVETMIDTALDDYYDKAEVDAGFDSVNATLSGKADTAVVNQAISEVTQSILSVSGDLYTYSAATEARLDEDEQVTAAALNNLNENKQDALEYYSEDTENKSAEILITNDDGEGSTGDNHINIGGGMAEIGIYNEYDDGQGNVTSNNSYIYADQTMVTLQAGITENGDTTSTEFSVEATGVAINGDAVATEPYVDDVISGKVDTSAITTAITSGSTDSEIPTAKAVYDAIPTGGGATYSAGTNISIDTANTINCTLPVYSGTGDASVKMGYNGDARQCFASGQGAIAHGQHTTASGGFSHSEGKETTASGNHSHAEGYLCSATKDYSHAEGNNVTTNNDSEHSQGIYNVSNRVNSSYGNSGNTLFSVGNGTSSARHNAFEIRQNGDIYFPDTDDTTSQNFYQKPMVRLQDMYGALGGLKLVSLTQSEYDNLATKSNDTLYIINDVVS